jgi:hypothetical protein
VGEQAEAENSTGNQSRYIQTWTGVSKIMSAEIIEQVEEYVAADEPTTIPEDVDASTQEQLVQDFTSPDTIEPPPAEDLLPEKYQGKSIKEVVAMHQSAEQLIGTQGSEVGELRKVVDHYINSQTQANTQAAAEPQPEIDFFEDPKAAVSQAIDTHPEIVQARQAAQQMKRTSSLTALQAKHPDMQEVLRQPAFVEWVKASPVRRELYQRADQGFDFAAADELVGNFKERTAVAQQAVQADTAIRQNAVRAATTGSTTGNSNAGAKRIYRRADIIKLMKTDPDRYEALSPEIMEAYRTGRVK